jgi:hypothetical protein
MPFKNHFLFLHLLHDLLNHRHLKIFLENDSQILIRIFFLKIIINVEKMIDCKSLKKKEIIYFLVTASFDSIFKNTKIAFNNII